MDDATQDRADHDAADGSRARRGGRTVAALLLALTLLGGASVPTYGHPDTLGVADPQWQRFPDAPPEAAPQPPVDDPATGGGLRVLETVVYGVATLAALLALSLARSFWNPRRAGDPRTSLGAEHDGDSRERA